MADSRTGDAEVDERAEEVGRQRRKERHHDRSRQESLVEPDDIVHELLGELKSTTADKILLLAKHQRAQSLQSPTQICQPRPQERACMQGVSRRRSSPW